MGSGEDYGELRASVGIHLLDFDLFTGNAAQREQAVWRFEMRDEYQPEVSLGNILQINLIELNKADRLGLPMGGLHAWVTFFKHGREERIMAKVTHEPTRRALERLREISADEEAQRLAFVRERALRDEVSLLSEARREGFQEGEEIGVKKGRLEGQRLTAKHLLQLGMLTDAQIATTTGRSQAEVQALRDAPTEH